MIESVLRRDRALMGAGLAAITALAWAFLLRGPAAAAGMSESMHSAPTAEAHLEGSMPAAEEEAEDENPFP